MSPLPSAGASCRARTQPGADRVLILGYEVWQEKYDGSPGVIGMTVRTNGEPRTIVGVAPEGFQFPIDAELWAPLEIDPLEIRAR